MTTAYTSLLGLALPVTGELSGTWGDTVNNSITSLLDSAIAGTTTLSSDADVTLTTTTGASNTSRQAILLWTAGGTVTRNITAPAQSKIYTVINASSSTQSIVLRGVGPTTGVTIVQGESAVCAWNGSDFIKISNTSGAGVFTTLSVSGAVTLSGGTANGVAYLNGSKVLTTGSALVFNGTNLGVGITPSAWGTGFQSVIETKNVGALSAAGPYISILANAYYNSSNQYIYTTSNPATHYAQAVGQHQWLNAPSGTAGNAITWTQAMTLDASGNLGIGTTSPNQGGGTRAVTLDAPTTGNYSSFELMTGGTLRAKFIGNASQTYLGTSTATPLILITGDTERARIDSSGNLGLGVTPTGTTGLGSNKTFEIGGASVPSIVFRPSGSTCEDVILGAGDGFILSASGAATASNNVFRFFTSNTNSSTSVSERMRLTSGGDLLVGQTTLSQTTVGFSAASDGVVSTAMAASTSAANSYHLYSTGAGAYRFYVGLNGTINATSIVITAISDQRLKENIKDIDTGLDAIMTLQPRRFDWKEGKGQDKKNAAGFIAQEFESVFPECVSTSMAGADGIEYKNINHETLIPTLVKAIQEQQSLITTLTARITALEGASA